MADEPDLGPGDSSEWVSYLQQMLNHYYGESVVEENGSYDDATASAVTHFRAPRILPDVSRGLGAAMPGLELSTLRRDELLAARGL